MKKAVLFAVVFLSSSILNADISVTDRKSVLKFLSDPSILRPASAVAATPDRAARRASRIAARQAKLQARRSAGNHGLRPTTLSLHPRTLARGSISLIDASGLKYFISTNLTSTATGSALASYSGEASSASYTAAVHATTSAGGTTTSTLFDMFDGYGGICVSLSNATGPCLAGSLAYSLYREDGPAAFDATVPAGPTCTNRQVAFPTQTIGGLSVRRKVFVPTNDQFIRWMSFFTNTTGSPTTFTMITRNNLGSDSDTMIVNSSNGDAVAQTTDTWISTFQNYGAPPATGPNISTDPRIGHVLQGTGAPTPVSNISFANGDDEPYWVYSITLAPGQTKAILTFATGQPSKAAANAKAAALALLPATATQCFSATELSQIVNFATSTDLAIVKNTSAPIAYGSNPITYTLAVTNNGLSQANTVSVSDTLPAGATFVSASGTGWTCNQAAGVVTCTVPTLPVGAAPVISLTMNAPPVASAGTLSNTATVSSATTDTNPANNSSTKSVPILPGSQIPAFSTWMLMMLAAVLALMAVMRRT
jgi:uncharacterized repeat protein (TIGR01451 family)